MKKTIAIIASILTISMFVACGAQEADNTYIIKFKQDGKTPIERTATVGEDFSDFPDLTQRTGYTTVWNVDGIDWKTQTENITVKTKATPNDYTITFDLGAGKGKASLPMAQQEITFGSVYELMAPAEVDKYYTFLGWYYEKTEGGTKVKVDFPSTGVYTVSGDVKLIAKWSIDDEANWTKFY